MAGCKETVEENYADYFDIMLIGRTGIGKSTTADKILLANPSGRIYSSQNIQEEVDQSEAEDHQDSDSAPKSYCEDLTMWHISKHQKDKEMVNSRLRSLVECRRDQNPHVKLGEVRKHSQSNPCFELLSNNTSKVRVLDVPGFFSAKFQITGTDVQPMDRESAKPHLQLMRKIIHIKESYHFKFNRIVYFLPTPGALNRPDQVLQTELRTLTSYFGDSIFRCMVIAATFSRNVYDCVPKGQRFDGGSTIQDSGPILKEAIQLALSREDIKTPPTPPMVFLCYNETCDRVYDLIKDAKVIQEGVELALMSTTCARCNLMLGEVLEDFEENMKNPSRQTIDEEKIILCRDMAKGIEVTYAESSCHPMLIPKYTDAQRFAGGIAHLITLRHFTDKWPGFQSFQEICIACGQGPGEEGCRRVGTTYRRKCKKCGTCKHCVFCSNQCRTSTERIDSCEKCQICATCLDCTQCGQTKVDHTKTVIESYTINNDEEKV